MSINYNISGENVSRNLQINLNSLSKATEKLSSGFRINRAGDDASGFAISEKMKGQIRGLDKSDQNIQDAISLINTADGYMQEIHNILHRTRELTIQSANGTYTQSDREKIQVEVDNLLDELNKISSGAEFNNMKLFDGTIIEDGTFETKGGMPLWVTMPRNGSLNNPDAYQNSAYAVVDFTSLNASNVSDLLNNGFHSTCCTCNERYSIKFVNSSTTTTAPGVRNPIISINISGITSGSQLVDRILSEANGLMNHYTKLKKDPLDGNKLIVYDERAGQTPDISNGYGIFKEGIYQAVEGAIKDPFYVQTGANGGNELDMDLPIIKLRILKIENLNVETQQASIDSIEKVDYAIEYISNQRARLGAYNNRLEKSLNYVNNASENLVSSNSKIRDTDMAKMSTFFFKYEVLSEVGNSILAQSFNISKNQLLLLK